MFADKNFLKEEVCEHVEIQISNLLYICCHSLSFSIQLCHFYILNPNSNLSQTCHPPGIDSVVVGSLFCTPLNYIVISFSDIITTTILHSVVGVGN